jgi:hypothetical protein
LEADRTAPDHLDQRDDAGTDHDAVGHVHRIQVHPQERLGVAAGEQADGEGDHRGEAADEGDPEGRHREAEDRTRDPDEQAAAQDLGAASAGVTGLDRLGGGDAQGPRATGREGRRVEHPVEQPGVEEHGDGHAAEHRDDHARLAEEERYADGQEERVGGAEGGRADARLGEVLRVDVAEAAEDRERDPPERHRDESADERGARGDAEGGKDLDAHEGAEDAENDGEDEVAGRKCPGVAQPDARRLRFGCGVCHVRSLQIQV